MNHTAEPQAEGPVLNRELLREPAFAGRPDLVLPSAAQLDLPEKAVQFGTGAFLRGFVEFFLDQANRQGGFGGRLVMVGSTGSGRDQVLVDQDGLYTLSMQGVEDGALREEHRVIGVVSRALSSRSQWSEVLACARNPDLELVFSNTTEVGIALDEGDRPDLEPPRSFPGKLTRFLLERARAFGYDPARGVVVIPCELIEDNGERLRTIVLALAERWGVEEAFARWVVEAVPFCNTLVDRIVPGTPDEQGGARLRSALGYRDDLLTVCEGYRLFAIQGDGALRDRIRFAEADPGVVVTDDVGPYRERKVRLLNGTHTIVVPTALLCGCQSVRGALEDERVGRFVRRVLLDELVPSVDAPEAERFAHQVLDRFANPFIHHALFDITLQATMKMRVRVVPSILQFAGREGRVPLGLALGFAGYLLFMRGDLQEQRREQGLSVPEDEQGARIRALWAELEGDEPARLATLVQAACADRSLWGADLTQVPGFAEAVADFLVRAHRDGMEAAVDVYLETASAECAQHG